MVVQAQLATRERPAVKDLRDWIARVEELGELQRITETVDWDQEMGAITYMVAREEGAPALLFENVGGYENGFRSLWNILGSSLDRVALTLGLPPGLSATQVIQATRDKLKQRIPPIEIPADEAPVNQNLMLGDEVDLTIFPAPRHWPRDGGRYIGTADAVITRDPESGVVNLGTYRMMVHDRNHLGLYLSPGKDARLHITRAWQRGEPLEVAAVLGGDPLLMLVGSQTFPKNVSEFEFVGGIKGQPLELTKGAATSLQFPAHAEIVIEGVIRPNATRPEGPFGEFTGYYGRPEAGAPLVEVTAIHYRNQPILGNALMADYPSCEMALFFAIMKSARIWDDLDRLGIPGIQSVYTHPASASGFGMVVISLEQRYAGHAAQVLALASQCPGAAYYTKWVVAVDEDIDPTDMNQVIWAMSTRCNPVEDIDFLRNTWSTWLDPTQNPPDERPYGSKALINACKEHRYLDVFSKRSTISREMYERVAARWERLGLKGSPPQLRAFDQDGGGMAYHESAEFHEDTLSNGGAPGGMPSM